MSGLIGQRKFDQSDRTYQLRMSTTRKETTYVHIRSTYVSLVRKNRAIHVSFDMNMLSAARVDPGEFGQYFFDLASPMIFVM